MEHREPPRIPLGDRRFDGAIQEPKSGFRLRTFDPFRDRRRIDLLRAGLIAAAAMAAVALLLYVGSRAAIAAVHWLHVQSQYQVTFDKIELVRELPSWYRGGKREFLGRVRRESGHAESISQLDVRPDRLALAFKLDPWVEEVLKVSYSPGRISLDLKIREPVAWLKLADGQPQIVDGEGRLLPAEDVDIESAGGLLRLTCVGLSLPSDRRPGVVWKSRPQGADSDQVEERIVAAAGLARFLKRELQAAGPGASAAVRMIEIILSSDVSDFRKRGLFILNSEGTEFCWGRAPGSEAPKEPTAREKWQMLLNWEAQPHSRKLTEPDYWVVSPRGLLLVCTHEGRPHRPVEATRSKPPPG